MPALKSFRFFLTTMLALVLISLPAMAGDGVPMPEITKGKGEQCVEPTDDMRKNHMHYLMHKRDKTLREGVRSKDYSLKECISCHVKKDDSGQYISITEEGQFCQSCHTYASVKVDCFGCHRTTPQKTSLHSKNKKEKHLASEMLDYLANNQNTTDE